MILYQLTFMDPERGKIVQFKRNKREISRFTRKWAEEYPLRELLLVKRVEIPDGKQEFVDWLNELFGGRK